MKNLSEVLNEVMTDIFTEDDKGPFGGSNNLVSADDVRGVPMNQILTPKGKAAIGAYDVDPQTGLPAYGDSQHPMASGGDLHAAEAAVNAARAQRAENERALHQAGEAAVSPSYLEQLKQRASNLGSTIAQGATDAGNYLAQKGQEAVAAYQSMPGYLQYGIPAAALAAGAGALYLRKKQKAANKAAGIR